MVWQTDYLDDEGYVRGVAGEQMGGDTDSGPPRRRALLSALGYGDEEPTNQFPPENQPISTRHKPKNQREYNHPGIHQHLPYGFSSRHAREKISYFKSYHASSWQQPVLSLPRI